MTAKTELLEQRISVIRIKQPVVRRHKKMRPKGWHTVLRRKRKASRRAKKGKR